MRMCQRSSITFVRQFFEADIFQAQQFNLTLVCKAQKKIANRINSDINKALALDFFIDSVSTQKKAGV